MKNKTQAILFLVASNIWLASGMMSFANDQMLVGIMYTIVSTLNLCLFANFLEYKKDKKK